MTENPTAPRGPDSASRPPELSRAQRQLVAEIVDWTNREVSRGTTQISLGDLQGEFVGGPVTASDVLEAVTLIHGASGTIR